MEIEYRYLRVPIQLDCFPVYKKTKHYSFTMAGQLTEFSMLPHRGNQDEDLCLSPRLSPNISEDLVSKPFEATSKPLAEGIHIHWTLPKALRTAVSKDHDEGGTATRYRSVPNRWMIQRKVYREKNKTENSILVKYTKAFVLESDLLSIENPGNSNAFPYKPEDYSNGDLLYRYIGKLWSLSNFKEEYKNGENHGLYLDNLTALGYGELLYAAYYPECRNVFGFHDDLKDIKEEEEKKAEGNRNDIYLSYQIIGWYSEQEKDPLFNGKIKQSEKNTFSLEDETGAIFDWQIEFEEQPTDFDNEPVFGRSLYCGQIDEVIGYLKSEDELPQRSESDQNLSNTKIAIGNTPGQALAALLANTSSSEQDIQSTELMLDALQLGLLSQTDSADLIAKIDNGMHKAAFQPEEGGHSWQIIAKKPDQSNNTRDSISPETISTDQITVWNILLTGLNTAQEKFDQLRFNIKSEQIQLYADWYKYMIAEYNLHLGPIVRDNKVNDIRDYLGRQMKKMVAYFKDLKKQEKEIDLARKEIKDELDKWNFEKPAIRMQYELIKKAASRFWTPAEPAILFFGENIEHAARYHTEQSTVCKFFTTQEGLSKFNHRASEQLEKYFSLPDLSAKIFDFEAQKFKGITWSPLFLDWQMKITPVTKQYDSLGNQANWQNDAVLSKFDLQPGETDLTRKPADEEEAIPDSNKLQIFEGRSVLTPGAHKPLLHAVDNGLEHAEGDHQAILDSIKSIRVLSQNLSGLNDAFAMHKQILQLKVFDPLADNVMLDNLTNNLLSKIIASGNKVAPLPSNLFLPIRDGWMRLSKLRIVDCFGQFSQWDHKDHPQGSDGHPDVIIAESLKPQGHEADEQRNDAAYLPPRLVQASRINFSTKSASPDNLTKNNLGFNPICGWVLPNFLEESLFIFDNQGDVQGQLRYRIKTDNEGFIDWLPAPGCDETGPLYNKPLRAFVEFFKKQSESYLTRYIDTCFKALKNIDPENYASFTGVNMLLGQPLALVQAEINLELKGPPLNNQSWESRMNHYVYSEKEIQNREPFMNFDKVKFPIHLGDVSQSNDGLVGFYLENNGKIAFEEFYSDTAQDNEIQMTHADQESLLFTETFTKKHFASEIKKAELSEEERTLLRELRSLGDNASQEQFKQITDLETREKKLQELNELQNIITENIAKKKESIVEVGIYKAPLTNDFSVTGARYDDGSYTKIEVLMLIDPRAKVHLTSGILPVKFIQLDEDNTAEALNKIETAFLTTPILSPKDQIALPTIQDEETVWTWIERINPSTDQDQEDEMWAFLEKIKINLGKKPCPKSDNWKEYPPQFIKQPIEAFVPFESNLILREGWLKINSKTENSTKS